MFIPKSSAILLLAALMSSCSQRSDEMWIAEERIPVYDDVEGKIIFYLEPSDSCEPKKNMAGKVDMYTKVKCPSGEGWVTSGKFKRIPRNIP
ncbi:hypothetical protein FU139_14505 [Burkholderia territorii]|nr:hypothetical protein FU139_14505 [Burkholderia territorii]